MGKKRKAGESRERKELEQLRSEEDKPDKKKQKRKRDRQLEPSQEREQLKDHENQRERRREKGGQSNNDGRKCDYLSGQIHETPNERDPLRVFLESLYQQLPDNELARQWMIEWGLLPREEAIKVLENEVNEKDVPHDGMGTAKAKLKKKKVRL